MKKYIVGNWKMNQTLDEIEQFFKDLDLPKDLNCETWIAPQAMHISAVRNGTTSQAKCVFVGGQNICENENGAFTGENSASSLKDIGCTFTLVGHSERRTIYNEDHSLLNKKLHHGLKNGLDVVFCIGETLEERKNGMTDAVIKSQLKEGLKDLKPEQVENLIVAYEPIWAIGTGEVATPEQAEDAHKAIRNWLVENLGGQAASVPLLYGGSVKPANAEGLLSQANIDGALVGGASLKGKDFSELAAISSRLP
jgi:triosephosphate isomerase